ncbi:hypothetical protein Sjap_020907 [Stephania japonica]|uniref:C2H2-type domain-containing protein n=1 Tax=Stephania japonica TaxID=461633 RepID=A0AAP0F6U9_9MAGN
MQKCDKCNREFCSPINYRRHIRVHRRSLNIGKNFLKNREFLAAFWDKLSSDEAKEIVSFDNVKLEEVPGSSIMKALTSFIRKPGFSSLTQVYVKAGAALLDVIQSRAYRFPLPSEELFSILDDASERTFLCAGTALSLHKFVFDGEAGKIGLEMRNLVACTSFLVEQKLVEAWLADKDAEALRCHKLLVEEEEAAQKRQADLLERKRLKKLRQKEQRAKEHVDGNGPEFKEVSVDSLEYATLPATEPHSHTKKSPSDAAQQSLEPVQLVIIDEVDARFDSEIDARQMDTVSCTANSGNYTSVEHQTQQGSSRWRRPASIARNGTANGFHSAQNHPPSKLGSAQKHGVHRDQQRATTSVNGQKVWTRKTKLDNDADDSHSRVQRELGDQPDEKEPEFLIGSISVVLGDCNGCGRSDVQQFAVGSETELTRSRDVQVPLKANPLQSDVSRARSKLWRPLGKQGTAVHNNQREADGNRDCGKPAEQSVRNGIFVHHDCCVVIGADSHIEKEVPDPRGQVLFCRGAAEVFLRQRWKEAIASEHVKLVLCPEADPPDSDCCDPSILCSAENRQSIVEPLASKAKFRGKPEKGGRLKYIPKHRNNT